MSRAAVGGGAWPLGCVLLGLHPPGEQAWAGVLEAGCLGSAFSQEGAAREQGRIGKLPGISSMDVTSPGPGTDAMPAAGHSPRAFGSWRCADLVDFATSLAALGHRPGLPWSRLFASAVEAVAAPLLPVHALGAPLLTSSETLAKQHVFAAAAEQTAADPAPSHPEMVLSDSSTSSTSGISSANSTSSTKSTKSTAFAAIWDGLTTPQPDAHALATAPAGHQISGLTTPRPDDAHALAIARAGHQSSGLTLQRPAPRQAASIEAATPPSFPPDVITAPGSAPPRHQRHSHLPVASRPNGAAAGSARFLQDGPSARPPLGASEAILLLYCCRGSLSSRMALGLVVKAVGLDVLGCAELSPSQVNWGMAPLGVRLG